MSETKNAAEMGRVGTHKRRAEGAVSELRIRLSLRNIPAAAEQAEVSARESSSAAGIVRELLETFGPSSPEAEDATRSALKAAEAAADAARLLASVVQAQAACVLAGIPVPAPKGAPVKPSPAPKAPRGRAGKS